MKYTKLLCLILFAMIAGACESGSSSPPPILFSETFEGDYDNAGWVINTNHTATFIELSSLPGGTPSSTGSYAYSLYNPTVVTNPGSQSNYIIFDQPISPSYVRIYMRAAQNNKTGGSIAFFGADSYPYPFRVWFGFGNTAQFLANDQPVVNQGTYDADTWYKVELKNIDFTTHTYDVYIDGTLVLEDREFDADTSAFAVIAVYNGVAEGQFYFDDILIR